MCGPSGLHFAIPVELKLPHESPLENNFNESSITSFVLKSGSGPTWKNIELLKPPKRHNPEDKFVTVLISHF